MKTTLTKAGHTLFVMEDGSWDLGRVVWWVNDPASNMVCRMESLGFHSEPNTPIAPIEKEQAYSAAKEYLSSKAEIINFLDLKWV